MKKIYLMLFLKELLSAIFYTIGVISLLESGNSISQASLALAVFYLSISILEYPTGAFADKYGRKNSTLIGFAFFIASFATIIYGSSHLTSLAAFFMYGLGETFISGSLVSWSFLSISKNNPTMDGKRIFIAFELTGRLAAVLGAFLCGLFVEISPSMPWVMASAIAFCGLLTAMSTRRADDDSPDPVKHIDCREAKSRIGLRDKENKISLRLMRNEAHHASDRMKCFSMKIMRETRGLIHPLKYRGNYADLKASLVHDKSLQACLTLAISASAFFGVESGVRNVIYQPYVLSISGGNIMNVAYFQACISGARLLGVVVYMVALNKILNHIFAAATSLLLFGLTDIISSKLTSFSTFLIIYSVSVFTLGWYFPTRLFVIKKCVRECHMAKVISLDNMATKVSSAAICMFLAFFITSKPMAEWWLLGGASLLCASAIFFSILLTYTDESTK